jgi:transposase
LIVTLERINQQYLRQTLPLHNATVASFPPPTVIGVDDFALLKGRKYGTIIVDLERHSPVDLLPDRSAETLCSWLKQYPEIGTIGLE